MRGPRVALGVVVLVALLVGTQLAFTAVGQEVGPRWGDPVEVATLPSDRDTVISEVAADGGDASAAAWIERRDDRWTVRVARLTVTDSGVTVGDRATVRRTGRELEGVDVAVRGDRLVVVYEVAVEDDVVLARVGPEGVERRVVSADPFRARGASVALGPEGAAVAYSATPDVDQPVAVRVAHVADGPVTHARVGGPTHGAHVPSVAAAGGDLSVTWYHEETDTARVTTGRLGPGVDLGPTTTAGTARVRGAFGGATRDVPFVTSAHTAGTVRPAWTDIGDVTTTTVTDGSVADPRTLGEGGELGVAASGDDWLLAWVVPNRATMDDVVYYHGGRVGVLSRLPSDANQPRPVFGPELGAVWLEWGSENRVLASPFLESARTGPVARLRAAPQRFLFLTVTAVALGAATVPMMPWSFACLFGAFVVTTGVVTSAISGALARLASALGRGTRKQDVREWLRGLPALVWLGVFALVEIPVAVLVVDTATQLRSIGFAHPLGASLGALAATVVLVVGARVDSPWRVLIVFVYLQNAALWAIAGTAFL